MTSWNEKLIKAADDWDVITLQECIDNGADVNFINDKGRTALIAAVGSWSSEAVDFLIQNEADLDYKDKHGYTALHYATCRMGETCFVRLFRAGASTQIKDINGQTVVETAQERNNEFILEVLAPIIRKEQTEMDRDVYIRRMKQMAAKNRPKLKRQ